MSSFPNNMGRRMKDKGGKGREGGRRVATGEKEEKAKHIHQKESRGLLVVCEPDETF